VSKIDWGDLWCKIRCRRTVKMQVKEPLDSCSLKGEGSGIVGLQLRSKTFEDRKRAKGGLLFAHLSHGEVS